MGVDGVPKVAKDRIEAVDPEKNMIRFRVLEGDVMKEYKTFLLTLQVILNNYIFLVFERFLLFSILSESLF